MECMYCESIGKKLMCDDCYEQREQDILDMVCPDCCSSHIIFDISVNMWYCFGCGEFYTWYW